MTYTNFIKLTGFSKKYITEIDYYNHIKPVAELKTGVHKNAKEFCEYFINAHNNLISTKPRTLAIYSLPEELQERYISGEEKLSPSNITPKALKYAFLTLFAKCDGDLNKYL